MNRSRLTAAFGGLVVAALLVAGPFLIRGASASNPPVIYLPLVANGYLACDQTPTPVAPANGASLQTVTPLFQWQPCSDSTVQGVIVYVDTSPTFSSNSFISSPNPAGGQLRFPGDLLPSTTIYWRLAFLRAGIAGAPSSTLSFTTPANDPTKFLPAPSLIAPPDGATLSALPVTFQWSAVSNSLDYLLFWTPQGSPTFFYLYTTDTQYSTSALSSGTTYGWTAASRDDYGVNPNPPVAPLQTFTTPGTPAPVQPRTGIQPRPAGVNEAHNLGAITALPASPSRR